MRSMLLSVIFVLAFCGAQSKFIFSDVFKKKENYKNLEKLPDHRNFSLMARFIVHNADWTAVSYKSFEADTFNLSMSTIFSVGDGPFSNGTGVPYFYLTELEPAVKGLVKNDSRCGLMMSLAQTKICEANKWDPEDPRCARVFLRGKLQPLTEKTPEHEFAKKTFNERHPYLANFPSGHNFFYAKYVIEGVQIISGFGGVRPVSIKDYFNVKDSTFNKSKRTGTPGKRWERFPPYNGPGF